MPRCFCQIMHVVTWDVNTNEGETIVDCQAIHMDMDMDMDMDEE